MKQNDFQTEIEGREIFNYLQIRLESPLRVRFPRRIRCRPHGRYHLIRWTMRLRSGSDGHFRSLALSRRPWPRSEHSDPRGGHTPLSPPPTVCHRSCYKYSTISPVTKPKLPAGLPSSRPDFAPWFLSFNNAFGFYMPTPLEGRRWLNNGIFSPSSFKCTCWSPKIRSCDLALHWQGSLIGNCVEAYGRQKSICI